MNCANCAAPLPPSADYCPKCGKSLRVPVDPPAAASTPVAPAAPVPAAKPAGRRAPWWVVPLVIVGLVVIAFLVLMGLPFGGRDADRPASTAAKTETIAEADPVPANAPAETATLIDVTEEPPAEVLAPTQSEPRVVTQPPPARTVPAKTQPPASRPAPVPEPRVETPPPVEETREISVSEAMSSVRAFITSRDYYGVGADCIGVGSLGYQNAGYTLEVRDTCNDQRALGRWRVDAKTREIFRQREDGRYLRP